MMVTSGGGRGRARRERRRPRRWRRLVLALVVATAGAVLWSDRIVHQIPPGHGGVLWLRLGGGTVEGPALGEGIHLTFPWDAVFLYDIRFRTVDREVAAVTRDGLEVRLSVSYRYRPRPETLGTLHRRVGPAFGRVLVRASMDAALRRVVARFSSAALHSEKRAALHAAVMAAVTRDLHNGSLSAGDGKGPMVDLDDVLLRAYTLPASVAASVARKNRLRQRMQALDYRLRREVAESHRKAVEARGIADFQARLAARPDLYDYLRLRGIAATETLARSPSSTLVVAGAGVRRPPVIVDLPPGPRLPPAARAGDGAAPRGTVTYGMADGRRLKGDEDREAEAAVATAAEPPEHPLLARVRGVWRKMLHTIGRWMGRGEG